MAQGFVVIYKSVLTSPAKFFEKLTGDDDLGAAIKFAGINFGAIVAITLVKSLIGASVGGVVAGVAFAAFAFAIGLPIAAIIFHAISKFCGGNGDFKKALQVVCYVMAVSVLSSAASLIPSVGAYLSLAPMLYCFYVLALASINTYKATPKKAYIFCGIVAFICAFSMISTQMAANKLASEMAKLQSGKGAMGLSDEQAAAMQNAAKMMENMAAKAEAIQKQEAEAPAQEEAAPADAPTEAAPESQDAQQ